MRKLPVPKPSETVEGALADLAGALRIVIELMLEEQGDKSPDWALILITAMAQWEQSGFMQEEANAVAESIADSYTGYKKKSKS